MNRLVTFSILHLVSMPWPDEAIEELRSLAVEKTENYWSFKPADLAKFSAQHKLKPTQKDEQRAYVRRVNELSRQRRGGTKGRTAKPRRLVRQLSPEEIARHKEKREVWSTWDRANSFLAAIRSRGILASAAEYLLRIMGYGRRVDPEVRARRILSCHGDPAQGIPACPVRYYEPRKKFHYCNDCGCGATERARLDSLGSEPDKPLLSDEDFIKLDYPELRCPRKRTGFSNAG